MGDSGSRWASALLERVFNADPESVLSPPDFELPWTFNLNQNRRETPQELFKRALKNQESFKKLS